MKTLTMRHPLLLTNFPGDEVPECPPRSGDEDELQPAAVTRQPPRAVLSREDAIAAIKNG